MQENFLAIRVVGHSVEEISQILEEKLGSDVQCEIENIKTIPSSLHHYISIIKHTLKTIDPESLSKRDKAHLTHAIKYIQFCEETL